MPKKDEQNPSFNLWTQPWITLELPGGGYVRRGIRDTLLEAHTFRAIVAPSPLEVVGLHRLLTAVLQSAVQPKELDDLVAIHKAGCIPLDVIDRFGEQFVDRFDLFSPDKPFFQSADLPLAAQKGSAVKTIAYLAPELPSGTGIIHYHHRLEGDHCFCPGCAASGLAVIPAFATSGGAGIKPSINGVPPMYILPGGESLFDSLAYSLVLPEFAPGKTANQDLVWWKHPQLVGRSQEIYEVGYLHSLTFPARRVRLHPTLDNKECTRCGNFSRWGVRTMIFEMGQSQPDEAPFWQDPFAAYEQKGEKPPVPLRPKAGKAAWREFGSLFLKKPHALISEKAARTIRPALMDQLEVLSYLGYETDTPILSFRCIGMRTDMKAKVFEWVDTGFDVSLALLQSTTAGPDVEDALSFAGECQTALTWIFQDLLNRSKGIRYAHLRTGLYDQLWAGLAEPFRHFILRLEDLQSLVEDQQAEKRKDLLMDWNNATVSNFLSVFDDVLNQIGDDGHTLRLRYQAMDEARRRLYGKLKKEKSKYE